MTFDEKVNLLKRHPKFMVSPITEIRAVAYSARLVSDVENQIVIEKTENGYLTLTPSDVAKILSEYPDLKPILK